MVKQRIHLLSQQLANQIAAGEVIERPASVVKELVENSLDAGATQMTIDIEKGGSQLIRIKDNGHGIHPDDLALALARHGTSKVSTFEDLERIGSLGFRGEALASIGSVSRLSLVSCQDLQLSAWEISAEGSSILPDLKPAAHPVGTTITVCDLFFNTPVRRKFLRSEKTEFNHIGEIIKRVALGRFDLRIQLQHNQQKPLILAAAKTELAEEQRLAKLCGQSFVAQSIKISVTISDLHLSGWIGLETYTLPQPTLQYFYVNGRVVRDKIVTHAIRQAYADLIPPGRQPAFVLFLQLDPGLVDVNVHPTKHEVRFREARLVHDFVVRALLHCLQKTQSVITTSADEFASETGDNSQIHPSEQQRHPMHVKEQAAEYGKIFIQQATDKLNFVQSEKTLSLFGNVLAITLDHFILAEKPGYFVLVNVLEAKKQIVIYKLLQQYREQNVITQPLLFPETISLTKTQSHLLPVELLLKLGLEIEAFGPELWLLRKVPKILGILPWQEAIQAVVDTVSKKIDVENEESLLVKIIHTLVDCMMKYYNISNELPVLNQFLRDIENNGEAFKHTKTKPWREFSKEELVGLVSLH